METVTTVNNFIDGQYSTPTQGEYMPVTTPLTGETIGKVYMSTKDDVNQAVEIANKAFQSWKALTFKTRALIMFKFHALVEKHKDELAELVMKEHGKTKVEALGSIAKGNETVEYACGLPSMISGRIQEVSRGVVCYDRRDPLGVIVSIVPFNFPVMVPMWTGVYIIFLMDLCSTLV